MDLVTPLVCHHSPPQESYPHLELKRCTHWIIATYPLPFGTLSSVFMTLLFHEPSSAGITHYLYSLIVISFNLTCVKKFCNLLLFRFIFFQYYDNVFVDSHLNMSVHAYALSGRPAQNDRYLSVKLIQPNFFNQCISLNH